MGSKWLHNTSGVALIIFEDKKDSKGEQKDAKGDLLLGIIENS